MIAILRIRGIRNVSPKIKRTLELLKLYVPNRLRLMEDSASLKGMLQVVKDYVTWGPISDELAKKVLLEKGEIGKKKIKELENSNEIIEKILKGEEVQGFKGYIRLRPPSKGYKDIKKHYPQGDLGKRPEMDSLIRRMI